MTNAPRIMTVQDQLRIARANGIEEGQRMMRDRIATHLASWAADHPTKVTGDELHQYAEYVRNTPTS